MRHTIRQISHIAAITIGAIAILCPASAQAQLLAPMKKDVSSFSENFIVKVMIKNPYKSPQRSYVQVYDENWNELETAVLSRKFAILGSGHGLSVTAIVPFDGEQKRRIYICHSIVPTTNGKGASYRGEVCGKYTATRYSV
ncbi:MAG: hypothetical protein HKN36_06520 [Hellea sp.]|nr:hypothetical protein [Hellea sp.]